MSKSVQTCSFYTLPLWVAGYRYGEPRLETHGLQSSDMYLQQPIYSLHTTPRQERTILDMESWHLNLQHTPYTQAGTNYSWHGVLTSKSTAYTLHPYCTYKCLSIKQTVCASNLGPSAAYLQPTPYTQAATNYSWHGVLTSKSTAYTLHPYSIYNSIIVKLLKIEKINCISINVKIQ